MESLPIFDVVRDMDAFFSPLADVFDFVSYHFHIIFSVMCGLLAAAWVKT
jgi:hypothetical protein